MPTQKYKDANGDLIPGVTTVLKQADQSGLIAAACQSGLKGVPVYGPMGEWSRKADIGTACHQMIHDHLVGAKTAQLGFNPEIFDAALVPYRAFLAWRDGKVLKGHAEVSLVSVLGFGGTIDYIEDGLIYDWKTSAEFKYGHDTLFGQLAAYSILAEEHGNKIRTAIVVRFPKEGGPAEEIILQMDSPKAAAAKDLFLNLLSAYQCRRIINTKNNK